MYTETSAHSPIVEAAARIAGSAVERAGRLGGGSLSEIWRLVLADGREVVAKGGPDPATEAAMLEAIADTGAPAPHVVGTDAGVLVIESVTEAGGLASAWSSLGKVLRRLHAAPGERYGWSTDYAFGDVAIVNTWSDDWVSFWVNHRVVGPAAGLPRSLVARIETAADRLGELLPRHPPARLLHGDLWGGNVLVDRGGVSALIDPACYYGDPEVDLAMLHLFDSPGADFYVEYGELGPGFVERRAAYQLWPAIVHARLFGSGYFPLIEQKIAVIG